MSIEDDFDSISLDIEIEKLTVAHSLRATERARAEARNAPERRASTRQISYMKNLWFELSGGHISKTELHRYSKMTSEEISNMIETLKIRLDSAGPLSEREMVEGQATKKQVAYLIWLRGQVHKAPLARELPELWAASSDEIRRLTKAAQLEVQADHDARGVPVAEWRTKRSGFVSEDVVASNGIAGQKRSQQKPDTPKQI